MGSGWGQSLRAVTALLGTGRSQGCEGREQLGVFSPSPKPFPVPSPSPGGSEQAGLSVARSSPASRLLFSPAGACAHHPDGDLRQAREYGHGSVTGLGTGRVTGRDRAVVTSLSKPTWCLPQGGPSWDPGCCARGGCQHHHPGAVPPSKCSMWAPAWGWPRCSCTGARPMARLVLNAAWRGIPTAPGMAPPAPATSSRASAATAARTPARVTLCTSAWTRT